MKAFFYLILFFLGFFILGITIDNSIIGNMILKTIAILFILPLIKFRQNDDRLNYDQNDSKKKFGFWKGL